MGRLGISIYVDKSNEEELIKYIDTAAENGFSRIFSCLLSVDDNKENILNKFKQINEYAHSKGFEIILDVNPKVFDDLGISYDDLTFFKETSSYGIRLDMGFTGLEESLMTFNPHDLKIEINMSNYTKYIDTIMDYQPKKDNIIGCHNFYPHRYSGLTLEHFMKCTDKFKKYG
ncbi:MAG: MupG family TIM beta-alpha barrel fold protein, partial [Terrisporobacter sp.]